MDSGSPLKPRLALAPWFIRPLGILSVVLLAGGLFLFARFERRSHVQALQGRLAAVADDRKIAIEFFIDERRGDALVIAAYPTLRLFLVCELP